AALIPGNAGDALRTVFDRVNSKVESHVTGREDTIVGVKAIEREVRMQFVQPAGIDVDMQVWTAKAGEVLRVPAIRELAAMSLFEKFLFQPGGLPIGDGMRSLIEEMEKDQSVVLRVKTIAHGPNALEIESTQEAVELSTDSVDAAIFHVPAD